MVYVKNERGVALPSVLLSVIVLSMLGMTLLGVAANQAARTVVYEKKVQAHYIARSGADAVAAYIIDHFNSETFTASQIADLNAIVNNHPASVGHGEVKVEVQRHADQVEIKAVGTVGTVTDEVTLWLDVFPAFHLDYGILALDEVVVDGHVRVYNGNVAAVGPVHHVGGIGIEVDAGHTVTANYTGPLPPEVPFPDRSELPDRSGGILPAVIQENGYYGHGSGMVTINVRDDHDLHILFDTFGDIGILNITGHGDGVVRIYVKELTISSMVVHNIQNKRVLIYVKDRLVLNGSANINGLLYAPDVEVEGSLTAGSLGITGALITNNDDLIGAVNVSYNPVIETILFHDQRFKRVKWMN